MPSIFALTLSSVQTSAHRLLKFNGVPKHTFYLHLKETGFRFNHPNDNRYKTLLSCFRNRPLRASAS